MAEAQEALELLPPEHLAARIEVDVEVLGVVDVVHPLGHIHFDATEGCRQVLHRPQVHPHIAIYRRVQQAGDFLLKSIHAAEGVEGIGLDDAEFARLHEGVPGHLGELGGAVLELHREHHIGVFADLVGADHQDATVGEGEGVDQPAELLGPMQQGGHGSRGQLGQGASQAVAQGNPKGKGHQGRPALFGGHGWLGRLG